MKTAVESKKKGSKSLNTVEKPQGFQAQEIEEAIRNEFRDVEGTISIRHLWTECDVHRFRINWWVNGTIRSSRFVHVFKEKDKITVRKVTDVVHSGL